MVLRHPAKRSGGFRPGPIDLLSSRGQEPAD
jgi:hypothetical protein